MKKTGVGILICFLIFSLIAGCLSLSPIKLSSSDKPDEYRLPSCDKPEAYIQIAFPDSGISQSDANIVKKILENRMLFARAKCGTVNFAEPNNNLIKSANIEFSGLDLGMGKKLLGKPGRFELWIQVNDTTSEKILTNDDIESANAPYPSDVRPGAFDIQFKVTNEGGKRIQDAAIRFGAIQNPWNHEISMVWDDELVFKAPLSPDFAESMKTKTPNAFAATYQNGDTSKENATILWLHMLKGALPVNLTIEKSGFI